MLDILMVHYFSRVGVVVLIGLMWLSTLYQSYQIWFCLFCCFTSQFNSYGHCGTVSSPTFVITLIPDHTYSWASLNKQLTSTSCTYFRL